MRTRHPDLSEEEYLDIEEALASNGRGRTFLRMRDQRTRVVTLADANKLMRGIKDSIKEKSEASGSKDEPHIRILREELREMSAYIHQTRREIAALRPIDAGANRIMAATGELEGIVSATERATSDILNGVEQIQALAVKLPKDGEVGKIAEDIQGHVTEVLTACSFQDITGQRTTKVVNTLHYIEQRVNSMIEIWGVKGNGAEAPAPAGAPASEVEDTRPDAHLMNGPAADGGPSQADVDALFERLTKATTPAEGANATKSAESGVNSQSQIDAMFGPTH
jgi:chemotaxis regulatin CheY-phosphate phosphatase CheZ